MILPFSLKLTPHLHTDIKKKILPFQTFYKWLGAVTRVGVLFKAALFNSPCILLPSLFFRLYATTNDPPPSPIPCYIHPPVSVDYRVILVLAEGQMWGFQPTCPAGFFERKPTQTQGEHVNSTGHWYDCNTPPWHPPIPAPIRLRVQSYSQFHSHCCPSALLSVIPLYSICSPILGSTQGSQVCPCVSALQSSTVTCRPATPPASHSDSAAHVWCSTCTAGLFAMLWVILRFTWDEGMMNESMFCLGFLFSLTAHFPPSASVFRA